MESKKYLTNKAFFWIAIILSGLFYFFLLGDSSFATYKDTPTFIEWSYDNALARGYLLYPAFLKICRITFSEALYLRAVNVIQCAFAMVSTIILEEYVRRTYDLGYMKGFLSFLAICGVYGYSLPEVVASHYIVTESLTFPLFSIMIIFLLEYFNKRSLLALFVTFLLCVIMTLVRPQMAIFVILVISVVVIDLLAKAIEKKGKRNKKLFALSIPILVPVITIIGLYIVVLLTIKMFGGNANSQYHEAVTGKVMCVMRKEDADLYEDDIRDGYRSLFFDTEQNGGLKEDFPSSILEYEKVQRIIDKNMRRGINAIWEWYDDTYIPTNRDTITFYRNRIVVKELKAHKCEYIGVILRLIPSSLVSSIFIQPLKYRAICNVIATLVYLSAIILLYVAWFRKTEAKFLMPMIISLILIYGNAILSNIVLYGQQRYVVYCFGIFYVSMIILLHGLYVMKKN